MKFKDLVLAGTALIVVYKVGQVSGHVKCFNKLMDEYGKELFENHDKISTIVKFGKDATLEIFRTKK
jgi:hypothetical protein